MRKGELAGLKWVDVNSKDGYIYIRETKNNESRVIPISDILMESLITLEKKATSEYVFTTQEGIPYTSESSWKRAWTTALKRSQIEKCRFHDLRHSFATRLVMAGVDIVTVQEHMGHKDISMTKRYSHPTPQHKKLAIERLNLSAMDTYMDTKEADNVIQISVTP